MWKQINLDKSTILGNTDVGRISTPYLTASIKRKNPDMVSTVPYYDGLTGTTLLLSVEGDVTASYSVTFTSDSYLQSLQDITTVCSPDIKGTDSYGYLTVTSTHSGNRNAIKITGGTSLSILGFEAFPHPAGVSYAGEIDSGKPTYYEGRVKGSSSFIQNEPIQKDILNRFGAGISYILDTLLSNLDREIAVPREYSVSISTNSFTINSTDRFYLSTNSIFTANPGADSLENAVTLLDQNNNLVFDSSGNRVRVTSITYGSLVDATSTFTSWGTADGKSIFGGLSHYQKTKSTRTITNIIGNTIKCSGATFITDKVQPNDIIIISGATNNIPFNHNGEFSVDAVLSEEVLQIKPKGITDTPLFPGSTQPSCLNVKLGIGEIYGTATIAIGKYCPLIMKSGSMTFNLSSSLTGTYRIVLPIGTSLRSLLAADFTQSILPRESGGQIELGSKLITTLSNALKPRIIAKPNQDTSKTYLLELKNNTVGCRIYSLLTGGIEIVYNGLWNGTSYDKDDMSKNTFILKEDINGFSIGCDSQTLSILSDRVTLSDGTVTTLTIPTFDGTSSSNSTFGGGVNLGNSFSTDNGHLVEKIRYKANTTTGKYTLLSETTLSGPRRREYVIANGNSVLTFNAKWNGTQWVKDSSSELSIKSLITNEGHFEYIDSSGTTPFSDNNWDSVNDFKSYQYCDEFTRKGPSVTSINGLVGNTFMVNSITNCTVFSEPTPKGIGEWTAAATSTGAFSLDCKSTVLNFDTKDFTFIIKARCFNQNVIDVIGSNGIVIGNFFSTPKTLAIKTGSDVTTWFVQIESDILNTTIPNSTSDTITVMFKKYGTTLNTYINKVLFDTRNYTVSHTDFTPEFAVTGLATLSLQEICGLDTFKIYVGLSDYQ